MFWWCFNFERTSCGLTVQTKGGIKRGKYKRSRNPALRRLLSSRVPNIISSFLCFAKHYFISTCKRRFPKLLHRYRQDRRNLLDFILSSGLIADIRSSSTSDIDFDAISADYVLECIQSGGGVLDVSKATAKHIDESMLPVTIHSERGDAFFLLSDPDSAGSPPHRAPPSVEDSYDRQRSSTLFFSNSNCFWD